MVSHYAIRRVLGNQPYTSTIESWASSKFFSPEWLESRMSPSSSSAALVIKASRQPHFMYAEGPSNTNTSFREIPAKSLFSFLAKQKNNNNEFYYFTAPLSNLHPSVMDIAAVNSSNLSSDGGKYAPSIWISSKFATTTLHYDVCDNIIGQMHGKKRLVIIPPQAYSFLNLYPDSSPTARKSKRALSDSIESILAECESRGIECVSTILEEGSSYFIPAFFFHQLEVVSDVSISVNNFSESQAQQVGSLILSQPPPVVITVAADIGIKKIDAGNKRRNKRNLNLNPFCELDLSNREVADIMLIVLGVLLPQNTDPAKYLILNLLRERFVDNNGVDDDDDTRQLSSTPRIIVNFEQCEKIAKLFSRLDKNLKHSEEDIKGINQIILMHAVESWIMQLCGGNREMIFHVLKQVELSSS